MPDSYQCPLHLGHIAAVQCSDAIRIVAASGSWRTIADIPVATMMLVLVLALVGHAAGVFSQFHLLFYRRIPLSLLLSIDNPLLWPCYTIAILSWAWATAPWVFSLVLSWASIWTPQPGGILHSQLPMLLSQISGCVRPLTYLLAG